MLNIVIPMAGNGSRFARAGYAMPKPLIDVQGRSMIEVVIDNLKPSEPHRFIFICQSTHLENYPLKERLMRSAPDCKIISINGVTEGAACTVLLAKSEIDNEDPLMIANCDQFVDVDMDAYLADLKARNLDGLIMTMTAHDPKWSYVRFDSSGGIIEIVEKRVVSDEATVGIYNYKKGSDFVRAAQSMISAELRVNKEFYVAPAYNILIEQGARLGVYNIGGDGNGMYGLGVPEDLHHFLAICPRLKRFSA